MGNDRKIFDGRPPGTVRFIFTLAITFFLSAACSYWFESDLTAVTAEESDKSTGTVLEFSVDGIFSSTRAESWWLIRRIDVFVFNDDGLRQLDSYNRSDSYSTLKTSILSSEGEKIVVAVANAGIDDKQIAGISRYDDLGLLFTDFTSDSPQYPVMSGEGVFTAGRDRTCNVQLAPLMSLIEVRSLKCLLEGKYAGKTLSDVKVYLTGLNKSCEIMRNDGFMPSEIMLRDGLDEKDLLDLNYSGMIYKYLGNGTPAYDGSYTYGFASLYCYPNECDEESIGTAFTRLMVEGRMEDEIWRYAIEINRVGYGFTSGVQGISRNTRYSLDILITGPPE